MQKQNLMSKYSFYFSFILCLGIRERILKDLMSNSGAVDVDEITFIEGLMKDIERKLERLKSTDIDQRTASRSIGNIPWALLCG